jgi:hypothetical protein
MLDKISILNFNKKFNPLLGDPSKQADSRKTCSFLISSNDIKFFNDSKK